jgi:hypothetical protein
MRKRLEEEEEEEETKVGRILNLNMFFYRTQHLDYRKQKRR